ncbi:DUF3043 domain-containing protein [Actinoalloteichus hymeniacidonis]|uniref:DUF3043 domain-containing protein n=1 Tax=Actinoalloteichus hymeniacidonis TaxID=340345 RepID=UPI000853BA4B|nr:DUF3043 domain-containing protein [Actinoalloteichus hymeniacidonis]MBB5906772.1 hypothetical protein [Actinoalloteichus hymeniacidonis]
MRFLRRNTSDTESTEGSESVATAEDSAAEARPKGYTPAKGRPTPSRRDAEGKRRGPVAAPRNQREAIQRMRGTKDDRRKAGAERRERMMSGDDRYLLPRDRGPVRAHIRDLVDSRRNIMGLFMPMAIIVFVAILIPSPMIQQYASLATSMMLITMIFEGVMLGRMVTKRVRAKFPDAKDRGFGIGWYCFTRATQIRRLRVPRPRATYVDAPKIWGVTARR